MKDLQIQIDKDYYHPGEFVEGKVILRTDESVKMRKLTLCVLGEEMTSIDIGDEDVNTVHAYNKLLHFHEVIDDRNELYPGEYIYPFKVHIPFNAIASYYGKNTKVYYRVEANVDVPLWFDVNTREKFFVIYKPERIQKTAQPIFFVSDHFQSPINLSGISESGFGSQKSKIGFKVELDKDTFLAGENIIGGVIINNPDDKKIRKIKVLLRAKEYATASDYSRNITVEKYKNRIRSEEFIGDSVANFSINIPRNVKPSFQGQFSSCTWFIEFQLDVAFAFDVKAKNPITIYQWY